ncbi:MAG TPA: S41 family peptidase [Bacteroidales bacterium]|nr:S41 family peptidase [Bacteroidales bacterium]HPT08981.1 S41 family peptidase [Bacteroidales bacterium]
MDIRSYKNLILFLFIALTGLFSSGRVFAQTNRQDPNAGLKKYNTAMQIIKFAYVDTVNESKLVEKALIETLKELDPHSMYISKKDVQRANEPLEGNFDGIGVQFEILRDTITVVHPVPGGPSEKLGIMSGDKIIRIEGEQVTGKKITTQFVFDHLRGKRGTKVTVTICRKGKKEPMDFTIVRDKIPINSVDAAYMIKPGIGYINLNKFAQNSMQEFTEAVNKLTAAGMKSLILDLRNNSGGFMGTAIELSDEFLRSGRLIVYTEGLRSPREDYLATPKGLFEKGKLVIMINENSASASEIVSGAIQDWDRGIIVGRRSFGKGLVQRPFQLPDSSQMRLTTARYYNPSGKCIQKSYTEGVDKYYADFSNRVKRGELVHPDSIKFPDSLKYYTAGKRVVYGGGGIMPDVFIPWDSTIISDYYLDLRRKNIINSYVGQYVDKNRKTLQQAWPVFESFDRGFKTDEAFMNDFFAYSEKEGVAKDEKGYGLSEGLIKSQLKGLIAQKLWDMTEMYAVINQSDTEVLKAIEVIEDDALYDKLHIEQ